MSRVDPAGLADGRLGWSGCLSGLYFTPGRLRGRAPKAASCVSAGSSNCVDRSLTYPDDAYAHDKFYAGDTYADDKFSATSLRMGQRAMPSATQLRPSLPDMHRRVPPPRAPPTPRYALPVSDSLPLRVLGMPRWPARPRGGRCRRRGPAPLFTHSQCPTPCRGPAPRITTRRRARRREHDAVEHDAESSPTSGECAVPCAAGLRVEAVRRLVLFLYPLASRARKRYGVARPPRARGIIVGRR